MQGVTMKIIGVSVTPWSFVLCPHLTGKAQIQCKTWSLQSNVTQI